MLEKTERMNLLYDFYGVLLTEKQRIFMELYYYDDLSLAEIAEQYGVTRQAVHDNIRRSEAQLEEYEGKLQLLHKYESRLQQAEHVIQSLVHLPVDESTKNNLAQQIRLLADDGESDSSKI